MSSQRILVGVIGRPHGVRGLVRVHSHAATPEALESYGTLQDDRGGAWTLSWRGAGIAELRDPHGRALAGRDAAEAVVNRKLYVDRETLPEPGDDEFYLADLEGLAAYDGTARIGTVGTVHDYGAGVSLEIVRDGKPPLILPFTRACVPVVDVAGGRIGLAMPDEVEVHDEGEDAA
jgi:16S rRNA processing protein RimM